MKRTGAQTVWEALVAEGVDVVFGYPGGAIMPTYDALPQYPAIRHVLVRHEQGAAHMADGYAPATGRAPGPWPAATRAPRASPASPSQPRARARRISSPASPPR